MRSDHILVKLNRTHYDRSVEAVRSRKESCIKNKAICRLKDVKSKDEIDNVIGTLAELATHVWSGEDWHMCEWTEEQIKNPKLRPHKGLDVGWWDVKATSHLEGNLLLRSYHNPTFPYVSVSVRINSPEDIDCYLTGWSYGWEAMQPQYERDPHGFGKCWIMPSNNLRSITTLLNSSHISNPSKEWLAINKKPARRKINDPWIKKR